MISRSFVQRTCVLLGIIALCVYLFYIGKGHTLLLDTNTLTIDDKELRSYSSAIISVNGKKLRSPMSRAERVRVTVSGQKHKIVIIEAANTENITEKHFTIPTFMDMVIVSIPAILGDAPSEYWVTQFSPPPLENAPIERMQYMKVK